MCTHGYLYFPYAHFPPSIFRMRIVRTSRLRYMLVVSYLIITPFQKAGGSSSFALVQFWLTTILLLIILKLEVITHIC